MKWGTTIGMAIGVGLLGSALWLAERDQSTHLPYHQVGQPLCPWTPESVTELGLRHGAMEAVLVRRDDQWFLEAPVRARADSGQVERLLGGLDTLRREELVTEAQRAQRGLTLADYGLADPELRVTVSDGVARHELRLGHRAPLGDLAYAMLAGRPEVIATRAEALEWIPADVASLRDRRILPGVADRVRRVELHRAGRGFMRLEREQGRWQLQQPVQDRADGTQINALLEALFALRVATFEWEPPSAATTTAPMGGGDAPSRMESFGLADDEATARILVRLEGELMGHELIIGKVADAGRGTLYAKRRDLDGVVTIPASALGWLTVTADELRERRVFDLALGEIRQIGLRRDERKLELTRDATGRWVITQPVQWLADRPAVEELVQALLQWRALAFVDGEERREADAALARPFVTLRLATTRLAAPSPASGESVYLEEGPLVVGVSTGAMPAVYARLATNDVVRRLSIAALGVFGPDPLDPLTFRDRTVLAIPPTDVQRLTLEFGGVEQTVIRTAAGGWRAANGTNTVAFQEVIGDVLYLLSNLRAERAVAHQAGGLDVYGLEPGVCVLTLGLMGGSGIQKSLILGRLAEGGGVYARVKGQDVVFTVPTAVAELLRRPLAPP